MNPQQASLGSIQGSDFGGHAPLVGARIFVMQLGVSGYGSKASSLLSNSYSSGSAYPTAKDSSGTATTNPTYGLYYVLSDATGSFNITGDYTCTVGYPVWVMGVGGSPTYPSASNVFQTSSVTVSNLQGTGDSETATYTLTTTTQQNFYIGEQVTFTNYQGGFAGGDGIVANVLSTNLTTTTFSVTANDGNGVEQPGTYPAVGTVTASPTNNPAAVNLAMLGNCPDGTVDVGFKNTVKFIYMNEVSTAAMAYAMAGFASTAANNDALHIGIPATDSLALQGAVNAALNAANLYDIGGGNLTTGYAGEGHIARSTTIAGNGTVPQAELDTLGNILASCVDSNNTYSAYGNPTGTQSSQCTTLFAAASSNGGASGGTASADTATAVMNIAHNPGTSSVTGLYNMPTGNVPFAPYLSTTTSPRDFTVAITYNNITAPTGIAIDAGGNAYVPTNSTTASYVTKLSPQGAVLNTSATGGDAFDFVAIAPTGNVWVTASASNDIYEFTSTLGTVVGSPVLTALVNDPTSVASDSAGYIYVTNGGNSGDSIIKLNSNGTTAATITNGCLTRVSQVTLDAAGYIWGVSPSSNNLCRVSNPGGTSTASTGSQPNDPTNIAIDSSGNGWASAGSQTNLYKITNTGTETSYGVINNNIQGGMSSPTWVAIDGANNVWVANNGNGYALSEFNSAGVAITGANGYQNGNLATPSSLAIDGSGDVWVPNAGTGTYKNTVTELIGAGYPVVTPLSAQKPGVAP